MTDGGERDAVNPIDAFCWLHPQREEEERIGIGGGRDAERRGGRREGLHCTGRDHLTPRLAWPSWATFGRFGDDPCHFGNINGRETTGAGNITSHGLGEIG